MSEIFKVCHLNKDSIEKILIFFGEHDLNDGKKRIDITQLYSLEPENHIFKKVFTNEEIKNIKDNNIPIEFIDFKIYIDDSIEDIKRKIILAYEKKISFNSIYLFGLQEENLNLVKVYQNLTQNERLELTKERLAQFLLNFTNIDIDVLEEKPIYNFEDLLELDLSSSHILKKPIGQKFIANDLKYQYTINPFDVITYDRFLEEYADNIVSTQNSNLLLDFGHLKYSTIYLTLAEQVFKYEEEKGLDKTFPTTTSKVYYPFLFKDKITNSRELEKKKEDLLSSNKKLLNSNNIHKMKSVDLFHKLKESATIDFISTGITNMEINLHPDVEFIMPLDIVFKLIHTQKGIPFIKYNPGNRKEKIYRLYSEDVSSDGRRIPYLNKAAIFKLMKTVGKGKSVSIYLDTEFNGNKLPLICEFDNTGRINIKCNTSIPLTIDDYTEIISENINPIIYSVKQYIEQSGYNINTIESLYSSDIEIVDIKYIMHLPITKNIHLTRFSGCISSVFNVLNSTLKNGIVMRFKRVANFNIMNAREATIIELINKGLPRQEVITILTQNFSLTKEEAETLFARFLSEVQVERGLYENKKLKIKENPGFLTTITLDNFQSNITIAMENINNIYYLDTIPTYINSLIVLTEGSYNKSIKSEVNKLCKSTKSKKSKSVEVVKDIVAPAEQTLLEAKRKKIATKAKEIKFDDDEDDDDDDDFMNMLLGDDEEDSVSVGGTGSLEFGDSIPSASSASPSPTGEAEVSLGESINSASPSPTGEAEVSLGESINSASPSPTGEAEVSLGESIKSASPSPTGEDEVSLGESIKSASPSPEPTPEPTPEPPPEPTPEPPSKSSDKQPKSNESEIIELGKISPEKVESKTKSVSSEVEEDISSAEDDIESDISSASSLAPGSTIMHGSELEDIKPGSELTDSNEKAKLSPLSPIESDSDDEDEAFVRDITGMQLSNPNFFFNRMEKRDPVLFLKKKQGKFNAYSRMCPSNVRRQPVILTKAELDKIDKEHPGSYDNVIKYGSNPKKQYYYICPRYWCLKDNTSLTEEEVNAGACGGRDAIIPFGARKVPPGKSIFEFNADSEHKGEGESYIKHYPGFIPGSKHPDGYCMPCCFKSWDAPQQVERRKECEVSDEKTEADSPESLIRVASNEPEDYIKGNEKFPLDQNRWGYLPISIQKFLHTDNKVCQVSSSNTNVKPFHVCFLRHGVEVNRKQSFISCIADLYADEDKWQEKNGKVIPSISEMKKVIKKSLTLDLFITLQNGNLIPLFYDEDRVVDIDSYESSTLYHQINTQDNKEVDFIEKAISSYENFHEFLESDDVVIDYKYLWDLVCNPNSKLFPKGINLIILEIKTDDGTEDVELVCPTNHYVKNYFETRKNSLILIKKDDFYEPVYIYYDKQTKIIVKKTFNEHSKLLPNIKIMIKEIKNHMNSSCNALKSQPRVYNFKENITLKELIAELKLINGRIDYLVLNYNGKVIGVKVEVELKVEKKKKKLSGFIPCFPSSLTLDESAKLDDFKFIDDPDIWSSYEDTKIFLETVSEKNKKIPCKIKVKIEDVDEECDEKSPEDKKCKLIVGVLTETNQFVQVSNQSPNNDDDIPVVKNNNYVIADKETLLNKNVDKKRLEYVKKLKLEKNFYNVFRNTLRITLNKIENRKTRNAVKDIINAPYILYYDKIKFVIEKLHELLDNYVDFYDYKISDILKIESVSACFNSDCESSWCLRSDSGICKIMLPKNNLVTRQPNEKVYFGRMADELVRYNRIKLFIFDPKTYLSFTEVKYNLKEDEIILLQSLITQDYFENLVPVIGNPFVKSLSYDTANPILSQTYSNKTTNRITAQLEEINCIKKTGKITGKWKKFLPKKFSEELYADTPLCTFKLVTRLIKVVSGRNNAVVDIKERLLEEYIKYFAKHGEQNMYGILFNYKQYLLTEL